MVEVSKKEEKSEVIKIHDFQDPASLNERATVDYIISEGLYNFHLFKSEREERRKEVKDIIRGRVVIRAFDPLSA